MADRFKIQGNDFLIFDSAAPKDESLRYNRALLGFQKTATDIYLFKKLEHETVKGRGNGYPFANIINDDTGLAFTSPDELNLFLSTNLGSLVPAVLPERPKGIVDFFIDTIGHVGTGVGWGDIGLIGDVPVVLFDKNAEEAQVDTFKVLSRILLADVDPIIRFVTYSTGLPVLTTGDSVRWQLEARYISEDELATKSPDETLLITQTFPYITANDRQDDLSFTLDRTLMTLQDSIHLTLSRIAGDGADNYNADVGASESDLSVEVTTFNP
jgi:hypothetical protein